MTITIVEAIKAQQGLLRAGLRIITQREKAALRLGIEALSYINICRHNPNCFKISLLPGETKE